MKKYIKENFNDFVLQFRAENPEWYAQESQLKIYFKWVVYRHLFAEYVKPHISGIYILCSLYFTLCKTFKSMLSQWTRYVLKQN